MNVTSPDFPKEKIMRGDPGDKTKQQEVGCKGSCPNLKEISSPTDMEGETYKCEVCGQRYRLYYEDMA